MSKGSQSLQVVDTRSPFAKALHILRDGGACPEEIVGDLSALVVELSRKHFGTTSEVMVEGALDGAVSLVSAGLLLAAGRSQSDTRLAEILRNEGIRGACSVFTQYVKEITEGEKNYMIPGTVMYLFFFTPTIRDWSERFKLLLRLHAEAKYERDMGLVKEWLVTKTDQGHRLSKKPTDDSDLTILFIRLVVFQFCGIRENIETDFDIEDRDINDPSIDDLIREPQDVSSTLAPAPYISLAPAPYKSAGLRFKKLLAMMPLKLRLTLDPLKGKSWFDENVILQKQEPVEALKKGKAVVKAKALKMVQAEVKAKAKVNGKTTGKDKAKAKGKIMGKV
jgi:hypothetical protein